MLRFLLMDLDDTVLDFRAAEAAAFRRAMEHCGIPFSEALRRRYSEANEAEWARLERGETTLDRLKQERFEKLFLSEGISADVAKAAECYEVFLGEGHVYMPGAEEMLRRLSRRYGICLATNGTASVQHGRIKSAGLGRYVQGVFISEEMGVHKPEPAYFEETLRRMGGPSPKEVCMIGDRISTDIRGAAAVGIRTVWYNPGREQNASDTVPDAEIACWDELDAVLESMDEAAEEPQTGRE